MDNLPDRYHPLYLFLLIEAIRQAQERIAARDAILRTLK